VHTSIGELLYWVYTADEFQELCTRGPGFGPGPNGPNGHAFVTGERSQLRTASDLWCPHN